MLRTYKVDKKEINIIYIKKTIKNQLNKQCNTSQLKLMMHLIYQIPLMIYVADHMISQLLI